MSFTIKRIEEMREQAGYAIAYINGVIHYLHLLRPNIKFRIKTILDNSPLPRKVSESITLASTLKHEIKNYKQFKRKVESFAVLNTTHGIDLKIKPIHAAAFAPASDAFAFASASAPAPASEFASEFASASALAPAAFAPAFAPASASALAPASARGGRKTGRKTGRKSGRKSGRKTGRKTYKRRH
jgi:hypothetical protein